MRASNRLKQTSVLFMFTFLLLQTLTCIAGSSSKESKGIYTVKSKSKTYYHVEFKVTPDNFVMPKPISDDVLKADGGQFEVYIKKHLFPINAPHCKKEIILRMPWTKSSLKNASQFIEEKVALYKKLLDVSEGKRSDLKVIIELNPYVQVTSTNPLNVELTQCNVFFRSSHGRYIDYPGDR